MKKRCDGCCNWIKLSNNRGWKQMIGNQPAGICTQYDVRVPGDDTCNLWKAIPYNRLENKIEVKNEKAR